MRQNFMAVALTITALLYTACAGHAQQNKTTPLQFSGYTWDVRGAGLGGPGPNHWDAANVWVDARGWLHLKISHAAGEWRCAELTSRQRFGFGRYQFQVSGRMDQFDRNTVLGLFNYPTPDVGADGTNEIDIEFARWGDGGSPAGNYTVWQASGAHSPENHATFGLANSGDLTMHQFSWQAAQISFQSFRGEKDDKTKELCHWTYAPDETRLIPQQPLPVHLNLWLFRGKPPTDNKEVEIVIRQFTFTQSGRSYKP